MTVNLTIEKNRIEPNLLEVFADQMPSFGETAKKRISQLSELISKLKLANFNDVKPNDVKIAHECRTYFYRSSGNTAQNKNVTIIDVDKLDNQSAKTLYEISVKTDIAINAIHDRHVPNYPTILSGAALISSSLSIILLSIISQFTKCHELDKTFKFFRCKIIPPPALTYATGLMLGLFAIAVIFSRMTDKHLVAKISPEVQDIQKLIKSQATKSD